MKKLFSKAIVRIPCKNIVNGLTTSNLSRPDYKKGIAQHKQYVKALESCGLEVIVLEADENYPDSTFVEDTALLTPHCAIITNPGAVSRKGETVEVRRILQDHFNNIEKICSPGTVEAGDIMMVGNHFYIGLSERTNEKGAQQLIDILNKYGLTGSTIILENVLHLKTAASYIEKNNMVLCGELLSKPELQKYSILEIDADEAYAANCVWINGFVLIPKGYPKAKQKLNEIGYPTIEIDVSEFQKVDGGLSCLSLRF
ncbi:MAG: N(G),N(G)-dimethylarginine dimethylaminohydrolase [Bacteroidetes bacterium]|nr:N(G),N(G)-dimethylarginine dimethylaminohydrolase [Bacteroidota bacterium]